MPRPFSCGTQYMDWADSNCLKCDKQADEDAQKWNCDIEQALSEACWTDGELSEDMAKRMGYTDYGAGAEGHYGWPCLDKLPAWDLAEWSRVAEGTPPS